MSDSVTSRLDLDALRRRLAASPGKQTWRCLDELAETPEFEEFLHREFPDRASEWDGDGVSRRRFLSLLGASLALAGLGTTGCGRRDERILPYVRQPEGVTPGEPLFFATAATLGGLATGLLVQQREGRPIKVEGNPDHPASLGATDHFAQASLLTLYDPYRSPTVTFLGQTRSWTEAQAALQAAVAKARGRRGAGLRVLTETVASPTLAAQLAALQKEMPEMKWHQYEPVCADSPRAGARAALGRVVNTFYDFRKAQVVLALDADFLSCGPAHLRYVREFTDARRVWSGRPEMSRLYCVESAFTPTGGVADHRLPLKATDVEPFARAVAARVGVAGLPAPAPLAAPLARWVDVVARDLLRVRGAGAVLAGDLQPPAVHALAHALNATLGNFGTTVLHTAPVEASPVDQVASLRELTDDMRAGRVEFLLILGGNPVFTAPVDVPFLAALARVPFRVHHGLYQDETARQCHWHLPETHYLESWGDARAYNGAASIVQPLIAPLYQGRTVHTVVALLSGSLEANPYELVRETWRRQGEAGGRTGDFEAYWLAALQLGVVPDSAFPLLTDVALAPKWAEAAPPPPPEVPRLTEPPPAPLLEIVFRPDPTVWDGRFATNVWLQEMPKPVLRTTWDNVAVLSPESARRLGLSYRPGPHGGGHGEVITDLVELVYRGRALRMPAWIQPGHPDDSVTVYYGYGQDAASPVVAGTGFNAYGLRTSDAMDFGRGLLARRTGEEFRVACVQFHRLTEGRDIVRSATAEAYREDPHLFEAGYHEEALLPADEHGRHPLSMYAEYKYEGYKWGMAIDLGACVGCGACVVACQAENNIPVVGKAEVLRGREMHWLRIDTYFEGTPENPAAYFQPVPCMHCEKAPCEVVCPVAATVHDAWGLNDMVYNRCVGTRFCSNNCPYKVRRFNFLQYADYATESLKMLRNPEVTVRSRGVMEKCTYCVQRIVRGDIEAKLLERPIRDGEVQTACQQACPARAIVFGDMNDRNSQVARMKAVPLNYGLLADLGTRPRTTYLAALRNPNPELAARP